MLQRKTHHRFVKRQLDVENLFQTHVTGRRVGQAMRTFEREGVGAGNVIERAREVEGRGMTSALRLDGERLCVGQTALVHHAIAAFREFACGFLQFERHVGRSQ